MTVLLIITRQNNVHTFQKITTQYSHEADEHNTEIKQLRIRVRSVSGDISSKPSKLIKTELQNMEIQTAIYFKMRAMITPAVIRKKKEKLDFVLENYAIYARSDNELPTSTQLVMSNLRCNMGILRTEEVTNKYIINSRNVLLNESYAFS